MNTKLPLWHELPQIELYMDQVLLYINDILTSESFLENKVLTASMINNYVKHHIISKPQNKKYNKSQIAKLIVVAYFKTIFSIQDIDLAIQQLQKDNDAHQLYDDFVKFWTNHNQTDLPLIENACQSLRFYKNTIQLLNTDKGEQNGKVK